SCGNDVEDFIAPEMAGGQNHVVLRDALQTKPRRLDDVAAGIQRRERRRRNAFGSEFPLNFLPKRKLRVRSIETACGFVSGIDRGHPHNLCSRSSGNLERDRIETANTVIERNRAVGLNSRDGTPDNFGSFSGWNVMRLQDKSLQSARKKILRQIDVVDAPLDDVGLDMNLQVISASNGFPSTLGNGLRDLGTGGRTHRSP